MLRTALRFVITACAITFAVLSAPAQTTPPLKPGLWQIHTDHEENGQKVPDGAARMQEHMKNMSPEQRKQFETMMKERGIDIDAGAGGMTKVCYSQKILERGALSDQFGCKTDFSTRSATSWKWHSNCPELGYQGDGEASFSDSENFVMKSSGVSTMDGKTKASNFTRTGKWLGADCGDVKPIDPKP
jgi:hypothetical protein